MGELISFHRAEREADLKFDGSQMRAMVTRQCSHCAHRWIQPKDGGNCPSCGSPYVQTLERRHNALQRI